LTWGFLRSGQLPAVRSAIVANFLVDIGLIFFRAGGFASGHLAAPDALGNAVLLIFRALADLTLRVGILHRGVVLVLIDLLGKLVLLLV